MRWSRTFLICMALAIMLFAPAAWLVIAGVRLRRDFEHEQITPLAGVAADLSKPGTIDVPLRVTYPAGHGFKVLIKGPPSTPNANEMEPWLQGLEGTIAVVSGPYVPEAPTELGPWHGYASGFDSCAIARIYGSSPGDYVLRLDVTAGAPALKDRPHKVVIMNDVCGCETLGVFWGNALAALIGVVAISIFAVGAGVQLRATKSIDPSLEGPAR